MDLFDWIESNRIPVALNKKNGTFTIDGFEGTFEYVVPRDKMVFVIEDEKLDFDLIEPENPVDYIVYEFGQKIYYSEYGKVQIIPFKYIGKAKHDIMDQTPHLGVRGKYEILNGSRDYEDWCKKAKFLGVEALGICEKNTLAGTLPFQIACQEAGIKPIIGETITIKGDERYEGKVYVVDGQGWKNLLRINKSINVDNDQFIEEKELLKLSEGLVFVFDSWVKITDTIVSRYKKAKFHSIYYQFTTVEYLSNQKDKEHLENQKDYLNKMSLIDPVLINDSFYLDKEDAYIKKKLNAIGKKPSHNQTHDQYFQSIEDSISIINPLFGDDNYFEKVVEEICDNAYKIESSCNFEIPLGQLHLPEYQFMSVDDPSVEAFEDQYGFSPFDNESLFWNLIEEGAAEKLGDISDDDFKEYEDRIVTEVDVIKRGGFIDYFLILWDIVEFCNNNNILVGVGRGSAGGSLVAYLLGITGFDPLKYGLLFERFLNEGRLGKGLPDIDTDIQGARRDEVKRYIESKFGVHNVTSIGTYGTLKIKQALKDFGKQRGLDHSYLNYHTAIIETDGTSWDEIFHTAAQSESFKKFVDENFETINDVQLCLNQPRTTSIHAAGVVVTPHEKGKEIYDWMPVRKIEGDILVSEWEGTYIEEAGFLKEDILGLRQLDKFAKIFELIKENRGEDIKFQDIPLDDEETYKLFQEGQNEDVFQFGTPGLSSYCKDLGPQDIEDLIAAVSLYRPGAMESNSHKEYVDFRNNEDYEINYDYKKLEEDIIKETGGMYIYQEQVMKAFQVIGGFSLVEADGVRKAMGKKIKEKMDGYRDQFLEGAQERGLPNSTAYSIWNKLEAFSGYGFNKSHATAYALTGYYSQWLKCHYPMEFWLTSLQFARDHEIESRIMSLNNEITVLPPDINKSDKNFTGDFDSNTIYWSITSIKHVGPVAVDAILEERKKGDFFSLKEFVKRVPKQKVNKRSVTNLIVCGCFDSAYNIDLEKPQDRLKIIEEYYEIINEDIPEAFEGTKDDNHFWVFYQRELCGTGDIDFQGLVDVRCPEWADEFCSVEKLSDYDENNYPAHEVVVAGILKSVGTQTAPNRPRTRMVLSLGEMEIEHISWDNWNRDRTKKESASQFWEKYKKDIKQENVGRPVAIRCVVGWNQKYGKLQFVSYSPKNDGELKWLDII